MTAAGTGSRRLASPWLYLPALALLYAAVLLPKVSRAAAGSDSSGYLNLARRLDRGEVVTAIAALDDLGLPATDAALFTPLGFVAGPQPGTMAPYYAPGLPLHMVALGRLLGRERGPALASPLAALAAAVLTWFLAREVELGRGAATAAMVIVGLHPVTVYYALQPMSDVLAMTWAAAAVLAALVARRRPAAAYAAGCAFLVGVAVRPSNALLAPALVLALPLSAGAWSRAAAGALPIALALGAFNAAAHGSPWRTGYGDLGGELALGFFGKRFGHYTHWLGKTLTPALPLAFCALPLARRVPGRTRLVLWAWVLPFFLFYCCYRHYQEWWNLRFLLPLLPALVIGALLAARPLWREAALALSFPRRGPRSWNLLPALCLGLVLWWELDHLSRHEALGVAGQERSYPEACAMAAAAVPPRSLVLAMLMTGALEHDTSLRYLRYDRLGAGDFERIDAAASRRGYRWFALVHPAEAEQFERQAPAPGEVVAEVRGVRLLAIRPPRP